MADTLPNIVLPANTWVDLYSVAGIAVGTRIIVESLSSAPVELVASAAQPSAQPAGFQRLHQRMQKINDEGDAGAWARVQNVDGLVNVKLA